MELLPSRRTRYVLLFVSLLLTVALIEALARALAGLGGVGIAVTLWTCFGVAYSWLLIEPLIRASLLMRRAVPGTEESRARKVGMRVARASGIPMPKLYVYESANYEVMISGIGKGTTILLSDAIARLDDLQLVGILAHEFGHIRLNHSNVRLVAYGSLLMLAVVGRGDAVVGMAANLVALWAMRQMEYAADRDAALSVGAECVRAALERIRDELGDVPSWQTMFSTHPQFATRIARLQAPDKL